jgi:hypothetical protein
MSKATCGSIAFAVVIALLGHANAQDLDPRRYVNLPIDQNFIAIAYAYSEGDVNVSPSSPLSDASIRVNGPAFVYLRTFGLAGNAGSFDALVPYTCANGSAVFNGERLSRKICGPGDVKLRLSYNFVGAKAVSLREFARQPKTVVVGTSVQVSAPTGQYDNSKLLNIGANRWYIKPEIGLSVPWRKWSFEFATGVRLFTDNADLLGVRLEQDPLYNLQAHVIYDLTRRQWVSLDANYFFGGNTYLDGVPAAERQNNSRLGLTWAFALNSQQILKVLAHTGVIGRVANDSDMLTVAWTYRWD